VNTTKLQQQHCDDTMSVAIAGQQAINATMKLFAHGQRLIAIYVY